MLRRSAHRRAGFTLIEMLMVVTIIVVLMSLLLAAVTKVTGIGPKADTTARIAVVSNAIGTFKSNQSFGQVSYIPAGRLENGQWLPFRLRNQYANPVNNSEPGLNSFEYMYLQQVFGGGRGLDPTNLGYPGLSGNLDANQTLTFFLTGIPEINGTDVMFTGFSSDPQRPFTRANMSNQTEKRRGPVLDLSGSRKYVLGPTPPSGLLFARVIDGYGNPFAYFTAYNGQANKFYGGWGNDQLVNTKLQQPMGNVLPYRRNGQFENPSGFQLISAGKDGLFGTSGDWNNVKGAGEDDQANFTDALLGAGPR